MAFQLGPWTIKQDIVWVKGGESNVPLWSNVVCCSSRTNPFKMLTDKCMIWLLLRTCWARTHARTHTLWSGNKGNTPRCLALGWPFLDWPSTTTELLSDWPPGQFWVYKRRPLKRGTSVAVNPLIWGWNMNHTMSFGEVKQRVKHHWGNIYLFLCAVSLF